MYEEPPTIFRTRQGNSLKSWSINRKVLHIYYIEICLSHIDSNIYATRHQQAGRIVCDAV